MAAVFHLQLARRRRWQLIGAIVLTTGFVTYLIAISQGADRLYPALFVGACALYQWFLWRKLAKTPDATIELDDTGIHFSPLEYWHVDRIDWKELTELKTERTAIWLLYRKHGAEMTQDIPRNDLTPGDDTKLIEGIQQRLSTRSQA